jgi:hypothetical protein
MFLTVFAIPFIISNLAMKDWINGQAGARSGPRDRGRKW